MPVLVVDIVHYLGDEPQPGLVECVLVDAEGLRHRFVDKAPIFSAEHLRADSAYPCPGWIACELLEARRDASGRQCLRVSIARPHHIESTDQRTEFLVYAEQLQLEPGAPYADIVVVVLEPRTPQNDTAFAQLETDIGSTVSAADLGRYDGDERGPGEDFLWLSAHDADALLRHIEPILRGSDLAIGYAAKRYGDGRPDEVVHYAP